nr:hypothetical protein [Streptomyces sp. NEAU-HV9]
MTAVLFARTLNPVGTTCGVEVEGKVFRGGVHRRAEYCGPATGWCWRRPGAG